jgi:hypothetical protein
MLLTLLPNIKIKHVMQLKKNIFQGTIRDHT